MVGAHEIKEIGTNRYDVICELEEGRHHLFIYDGGERLGMEVHFSSEEDYVGFIGRVDEITRSNPDWDDDAVINVVEGEIQAARVSGRLQNITSIHLVETKKYRVSPSALCSRLTILYRDETDGDNFGEDDTIHFKSRRDYLRFMADLAEAEKSGKDHVDGLVERLLEKTKVEWGPTRSS